MEITFSSILLFYFDNKKWNLFACKDGTKQNHRIIFHLLDKWSNGSGCGWNSRRRSTPIIRRRGREFFCDHKQPIFILKGYWWFIFFFLLSSFCSFFTYINNFVLERPIFYPCLILLLSLFVLLSSKILRSYNGDIWNRPMGYVISCWYLTKAANQLHGRNRIKKVARTAWRSTVFSLPM